MLLSYMLIFGIDWPIQANQDGLDKKIVSRQNNVPLFYFVNMTIFEKSTDMNN